MGVHPAERAGSRVAFADNLRGVAAFSVFVSHVLGVFWLNNVAAAGLANTPGWCGSAPRVAVRLNSLPYLNYGYFGVALFFLISGFVIPFSFQKLSGVQFLVARAFRIWPTYVAGFCLTLGWLGVAGWYFQRPFPYTAKTVVSNLFLVQDLAWVLPVDGVCWSLEVEIKFYLLCALLAGSIVRARMWVLLVTGAAFVGLTALTSCWVDGLLAKGHIQWYALTWVQQTDCALMAFMFIGTLFHFHFRREISTAGLMGGGACLLAAFGLQYWMAIIGQNGAWVAAVANYSLALGVFSGFYLLRDRVRFPRVFKWAANISYSFYLVHAVFSYVMMRVVLDVCETRGWVSSAGYHRYAAMGVALAGSTLLAGVLYWAVEKRTNEWGKKVAGMMRGRQRAAVEEEDKAPAEALVS